MTIFSKFAPNPVGLCRFGPRYVNDEMDKVKQTWKNARYAIADRIAPKPNGLQLELDIYLHSKGPSCAPFLGQLVERRHQKSESFVQNFAMMLGNMIGNSAVNTVAKITSGTNKTPWYDAAGVPAKLLDCGTGSATSYGIVVGTGTASAAPADYQLSTLIANGSGASQLTYQNQVTTAVSVAGQTSSFTTYRQFLNQSGATITVKEIGMIVQHTDNTPALGYYLIIHDNISNFTVNALDSFTVVYTVSITT